jgi:protein-S-isoprenylcysteine O-methyltransferase Ste14
MRLLYASLIPALWGIWLVYWCIAAFTAKPVQRREPLGSRLAHTTLLAVSIALLSTPHIHIAGLSARFVPRTPAGFWIGVALVLSGLLFSVAARLHLGGNWSGTVTLKQDHTLTRSGPYRFVRHPIYTGILLAILGSAIAVAQWGALLALLLTAVAFLIKIRTEERFMLDHFGAEYARYQQEVAALIPGLF